MRILLILAMLTSSLTAQQTTIVVSPVAPSTVDLGDFGAAYWYDTVANRLKRCVSTTCTWVSTPRVTSIFGRSDDVTAAINDYTWAQIDKSTSSLADITTRSASDLTSGTLPDARFPTVLPAVSGANLTNLPSGGVPTGAVVLIVTGTCSTTLGAGWAEETTLNGKFALGTLAASSDIGNTGGNDNITPAGTNSAPTFTGDALTSHTHTYTEVPNHVHVQNVNTGTTGGSNGYGVDTSTNGSGATAISTANPTGGVATGTTAGPSVTLTPSGTVSTPAFTGTQFDNRSAFVKVIFCKKS